MSQDPFPQIKFSGQLRPSQSIVVEIAKDQLSGGDKRLHIVAPPGSGKTVLGLIVGRVDKEALPRPVAQFCDPVTVGRSGRSV